MNIKKAECYFTALCDLFAIAAATGGVGIDWLSLHSSPLAADAELAAFHIGRAWANVA